MPSSARSAAIASRELGIRRVPLGWVQGMILSLVITLLARQVVALPVLSIMGAMVIAIILGIGWRAVLDLPESALMGTGFAAKYLLRLGIILMGVRLDIYQVIEAGPRIILIDTVVIAFTITLFWVMARKSLGRRLALLLGVGTGVCGAAAIAAVAPLVEASDDETAVSVATISLLGAVGALAYTLLYPVLGLSSYAYGVLTGSTLQEVAHVVAAGAIAGGDGAEMAVLTKLGRVALLIPVAIAISALFLPDGGRAKTARGRSLPVPWFILGFLGFSLINTFGLLPRPAAGLILQASFFTLTMAMAALGLNVHLSMFRRIGLQALSLGIAGSVLLALLGRLLLVVFSI